MTTEQTAQQLELAAKILRTGHPWGYRRIAGSRYKYNTPIEVVADGNTLSPLLATPPDNRPLHNPDNLTAEQVGVGYRLALPGESAASPHDFWDGNTWKKAELRGPAIFAWCGRSCRLPLSVPWPEPVDPYAELKAAHAAGKVIQILNTQNRYVDADPTWMSPPEAYRIKPEEPAFQLPPCAPGMRWHREDGWTADDLPSGYRPLVQGERMKQGSDSFTGPNDREFETVAELDGCLPMNPQDAFYRTTRPLVFNHAGKTWTWHRPGDPMPCDGERMVHILTRDNDFSEEPSKAEDYEWNQIEGSGRFAEIIGWRYAEPQTKTVPLGPEDVPPGSVFRSKDQPTTTFWTVAQVWEDGFYLRGDSMPWGTARERMQINRSIPLTGKWNPDAWELCSKTIPA